jgi:large subunit ribosomal protein LP0
MPKPTTKAEKKAVFLERLDNYVDGYSKILIIHADNVTSLQMAQVRRDLRGKAVVLMGKNTMIRRQIRLAKERNPTITQILPKVTGNVGFIFTNGQLDEVAKIVESNKKQSIAKMGAISPIDVTVPKGTTGLEPTQTAFFQALNIATKITKGAIEIINDTQLLFIGQKVGQTEAVLLAKLGIKPFQYGLRIDYIYDNGSIYSAEVLKIKPADLQSFFLAGISEVAAFSLGVGYLSKPALPHYIANAFKNVAGLSLAVGYSFPLIDKLKAGAAAAAAAAPAKGAAAPAAAAAAKKAPEPEPEEEDDGMGMSLFD